MKNSTDNVFDDGAIDAFNNRFRRKDFIEELGRAKPKIVAQLMNIANS
jgi:hypothetical protein